MFLFKSITRRIIFLHVVAILITSVFMPVALYLLLRSAADDLQHRALRENAGLIASHLSLEANGRIALDLPPELVALFSESYGRYVYSVANASGRVLYSSLHSGKAVFENSAGGRTPEYLETKHRGAILSGVSIPFDIGTAKVFVQIAQDPEHRDVLVDDIVRDFFSRVGWITIPILLSLLVIDVSIFRGALSPLLMASEMAEKIGPERTDVRLPLDAMPKEVRPLVQTINEALDRLERGFMLQREFTGDAAHELRTPLSILQARIDTIPDKPIAKELSRDIARMKRVVSQLLDIAELEAFKVGPEEIADLKAVCVEAAGFVAPLAVAEGKQILLEAPETPVPVNGNAEVLFRAVRNIAENAIRHTPKGGTVTIAVRPEGQVSIADEGPGIPDAERKQIFQRFWRKDRRGSAGAGLGLSIVKRIMDAHRGEIVTGNRREGGCVFTLKLPARPLSARGAARNEEAGGPLPAAVEDFTLGQGDKA